MGEREGGQRKSGESELEGEREREHEIEMGITDKAVTNPHRP